MDKKNFKLIAFAGPMGVGKTTAAKMSGADVVISFADPLKAGVMAMFNLTPEQVKDPKLKTQKISRFGMSPREILQWIGTDVLRHRWSNFWVLNMCNRIDTIIEKFDGDVFIAIDDVRFEDEAKMIRNLNGTIVHVLGRTTVHATAEEYNHSSESGIKLYTGDVTLNNDTKGLDVFERSVRRLVNYLYEEDQE